ncbi:MAG: response regulator, partial [Bacteroidota bacterium]|nr:response regulator [Bacteroidota bacterium]
MSTNNSSKKIVIADSQFLVIETLKTILDADERFIVAGIVNSQMELLKVLENGLYELLITDFSLIDYDSIDDLLKIKQKFQHITILILTNSISKTEFAELSKIGVKNIIYKTADRD